MQEVNIYILNDIKGPGRKKNASYIYAIEMAQPKVKGCIKEIGTVTDSTANQAELIALIEALGRFNRKCVLNIHTSNKHLLGAFANDWTQGWQKNSWRTASGREVANRHEWERLLSMLEGHLVRVCELDAVHLNMLEAELYKNDRKNYL
mgnify:FL=1|nr:MAG TPA: ribonuclease HI [Caudoviricetes sp.]DAM02688.1 MAG TPA: ribonuclease HI [Caudoviricetes sp.]